jgi:carbon monoxide dehydrogenase subunit G
LLKIVIEQSYALKFINFNLLFIGFLHWSNMITSTIKFTVKAPVEVVWEHMTDVRYYTHCIPGCVACKATGPDTNLWILDFRVGPFVKRMEIKGKTIEVNPPYHGKWIGQTDGATVSGETELKANGSDGTNVLYTMGIEPKSIMLQSLKPLIKEKMIKDLKLYAKNVKDCLE